MVAERKIELCEFSYLLNHSKYLLIGYEKGKSGKILCILIAEK
jgi:hypothetical protein